MAASTQPTGRSWLNTENLEIILDIWQYLLSATEIIVDILMFICSVYLILSYSVPTFSNPGIVTTALAVMVAAPELLLAGAFMKSSQLRLERNSKGWPLTIICWSFLLLTIITVGSLVYALDDNTAKIIVVTRCGLGIAYGLLSIIAYREDKAKREQNIAIVQSIPELFVPYLQQLQQSNQQTLTHMRDLLTRDDQEKLTLTQERLTRDNQEFLTRLEESNQQALTQVLDRLSGGSQHVLTQRFDQLDQQNQAMIFESIAQLREENENVLRRALERIEQMSSRKIDAVLTQVRVTMESTEARPALTSPKGQRSRVIEGSKAGDIEGQTFATRRSQTGVKPDGDQGSNRGVSGHESEGQESESSGVKAQKFIATYLAAEGSLPRPKVVMDATGCVKNTARKYLQLAGSTEQDEE